VKRPIAAVGLLLAGGAFACGIKVAQDEPYPYYWWLDGGEDAALAPTTEDAGEDAGPAFDAGEDAAPIAVDAGDPNLFAKGLSNPTSLIVVGDTPFWVERDSSGNGVAIATATKGGAPKRIVTQALCGDLASDGAHLFFTVPSADAGGMCLVYSAAFNGAGLAPYSPAEFPSSGASFNELFAAGGGLYAYGGAGASFGAAIYQITAGSGSDLTGVVLPGYAITSLRATDGQRIFFTAHQDVGADFYFDYDTASQTVTQLSNTNAYDPVVGMAAAGGFLFVSTFQTAATIRRFGDDGDAGSALGLVYEPSTDYAWIAADSEGIVAGKVMNAAATASPSVSSVSVTTGELKDLWSGTANGMAGLALSKTTAYWLETPGTASKAASLMWATR
jgi:hypothetical protein